MKPICLFIFSLLCSLSFADPEKKTSIEKVSSTPFSDVTLKDGVLVFTLKRKWFSKNGESRVELVQPSEKQLLVADEELLIYERHTKVVIRNDGKGKVTLTTTFNGQSFGSEPTTKKKLLLLTTTEHQSK